MSSYFEINASFPVKPCIPEVLLDQIINEVAERYGTGTDISTVESVNGKLGICFSFGENTHDIELFVNVLQALAEKTAAGVVSPRPSRS